MENSETHGVKAEGNPLNERSPELFGEQLSEDGRGIANGKLSTDGNQGSSTKDDIRHIGNKIKRLFGERHDDSSTGGQSLFGTVQHDVAFNPGRVQRELGLPAKRSKSTGERTKNILSGVSTVLAHPKKAAKNKAKKTAAGKISSTQRPFASQKAELEYLEVQEAASRSDTSRSSSQESSDEDGLAPFDKGKLLEERRDSIRAAWITSRIRRVRVVPKGYLPFPRKHDFEERDQHGQLLRVRWVKWLGNLLLYYTQNFSAQYVDDFEELPFDVDTFRIYTERLVMETGHWQTWAMKVRSVYRWEDPAVTGKWLALFLFLWYTNYEMSFLYGYIIYRVVRNKYYPSSLKNLQESEQRAHDREAAAFQIGELIERHGQGEWFDPFIETMGPHLQLQLGDIANILEVLHNFYQWKSPWKTIWSLCFFAACLSVSLLTSLEYSLKILWFIIGGSFFFCWPMASRYPQYRYLVSPIKWIMWDIPTHAEWSFSYLRKHAQTTREAMIERKVESRYKAEAEGQVHNHYEGHIEVPHPHLQLEGADDNFSTTSSESEDWESAASTSSILEEDDITGFRAHWEGVSGRLVIYSSGIYFTRSFPRKRMWDVPFMELEELWKEKGDKHRRLTLHGLQKFGALHLKDIHGSTWTLDPMKDQDEAFNAIIGFSGLQWQSLQTEPGKGRAKGTGSSILGR